MRPVDRSLAARRRPGVRAPLALLLALAFGASAGAAPPPKVDCSKYTGAEKEACEKMMSKKKQ